MLARIYFQDGHQEALSTRRQKNGLLTVRNAYYDSEGYYVAHKSFELSDMNYYSFLDDLDRIEKWVAVKKIKRFN